MLPLRFELRALRGAAPPRDLFCCGPGGPAIAAWAASVGPTDRPVVLAGLAGGVSARAEPGRAFAVARVIDGSEREWRPPLAARLGARQPPVTLIGTGALVSSTDTKRRLAERYAADLVDLESTAFAEAATQLGWNWGIVRGISDGASDALPADSGDWVDGRGRTRLLRVVGRVAREPSLIPRLKTLRSNGVNAMRAVSAVLAALR